MSAPTGEQFVISLPTATGESRAVITQLAAALRQLTVDGVDITQPYPETARPPFANGIVLMPWPNRVRDGSWQLDGHPQQLDLTEPDKNNALHGLLRFSPYTLVGRTASSITLGATVFPQHGYPFLLATTVAYEVVDDGLRVIHTVENLSSERAPVGVGAHPFLTIGGVAPEDLTLTVHASTYFDVDARLNPIAELPVDGTRFDLRQPRRVADLQLDTAFGRVATVDGVSAVLRAPDGREVRLLQDENHAYVQVFTTRIFPTETGPSLAVAVEPMTAAPDALNSELGLHWIEPGDTWTVGWGIQYSR